MSFFIRSVVIISLLTSTLSAQAEDKKQEVKNLLDQFHHEIEHGEHDETKSKLNSVLSQWIDNFNLARISMDTHRWTQMKYYQDSGKSEYIRNFPVLASFYFLSHTLEVFSGPIGVYLANDFGLGNSVKVAIGSIGAIISVPGLDPLCILLFTVSPFKPMQKMMTGIRIVAVKVSGGVTNQLGLKNAAQKIFENKDRLTEIVRNSSDSTALVYDVKSEVLLKQLLIKNSEGKPYLALNFKSGTPTSGSEKTWVHSLEVIDAELLEQNKKPLDKILNQFNLSVRYALRQAIRKPRKTFYTDAMDSTNIQFKDYAVLLKPKLALRKQVQNETLLPGLTCQSLFQ